jgi:hypothetical protein
MKVARVGSSETSLTLKDAQSIDGPPFLGASARARNRRVYGPLSGTVMAANAAWTRSFRHRPCSRSPSHEGNGHNLNITRLRAMCSNTDSSEFGGRPPVG